MLTITNCIRCGKERIITKTWSEKVGESVITRTLSVCPDAECQKIVEDQLQKKNDRVREIQEQSSKRRANLRGKKSADAGK